MPPNLALLVLGKVRVVVREPSVLVPRFIVLSPVVMELSIPFHSTEVGPVPDAPKKKTHCKVTELPRA